VDRQTKKRLEKTSFVGQLGKEPKRKTEKTRGYGKKERGRGVNSERPNIRGDNRIERLWDNWKRNIGCTITEKKMEKKKGRKKKEHAVQKRGGEKGTEIRGGH